MNYTRKNLIGVDKAIDKIQRKLYGVLSSKGSIKGYSRVYKNKRNGFVFEAYVGSNEYEDVLGTDESKFFFVDNEQKNIDQDPSSLVDIVFMVDLNDFFTSSEERKDEEFKSIVYTVLQNSRFKMTQINGHERLETLLRGYGIGKSVEFDHLHPKLIFTIQGTLNYNLKTCI